MGCFPQHIEITRRHPSKRNAVFLMLNVNNGKFTHANRMFYLWEMLEKVPLVQVAEFIFVTERCGDKIFERWVLNLERRMCEKVSVWWEDNKECLTVQHHATRSLLRYSHIDTMEPKQTIAVLSLLSKYSWMEWRWDRYIQYNSYVILSRLILLDWSVLDFYFKICFKLSILYGPQ